MAKVNPYPGPSEPEVYRFDGPWPGTVRPDVDAPVTQAEVAKKAAATKKARKTTKKAAKK